MEPEEQARIDEYEIHYAVAEKFKSLQGEGVYAGTPMAFIRFVGCSVGKTICTACDTDFEKPLQWRGGGLFSAEALSNWIGWNYDHVCLTGGEPLDQKLPQLLDKLDYRIIHLETSGTKHLGDFRKRAPWRRWVTVSPKPGYIEEVVLDADEVKVIVPGLGSSSSQLASGWPTLEDAIRWADKRGEGKPVFLQPRNLKHEIDKQNLRYVLDILADHPNLRLSNQLHKQWGVQ